MINKTPRKSQLRTALVVLLLINTIFSIVSEVLFGENRNLLYLKFELVRLELFK